MNPALLSLLVLVACAPLAHRLDAPDSARAPTTPPAARPGVALVLYAEEPLTAPPADPLDRPGPLPPLGAPADQFHRPSPFQIIMPPSTSIACPLTNRLSSDRR